MILSVQKFSRRQRLTKVAVVIVKLSAFEDQHFNSMLLLIHLNFKNQNTPKSDYDKIGNLPMQKKTKQIHTQLLGTGWGSILLQLASMQEGKRLVIMRR